MPVTISPYFTETLTSTVHAISIIDTMVALLAGLAIYPIVFSHSLPVDGRPGLMFQTLPIAFGNMVGGNFIGMMFFLLLFLAAWSIAIVMVEAVLTYIQSRMNLSRKISAYIIVALCWMIGIGSVLSFNLWQDYKILSKWTIFDALTEITSNILLPLGGLSITIFVGWIMNKRLLRSHFQGKSSSIFIPWYITTRYITPICIAAIMICSII